MQTSTMEPDSELAFFLKSLAEEGRAVISSKPLAEEQPEAPAVLVQLDALRRDELGLDAPSFDPAAALWAARLVYQLCQFVACRDIGLQTIAEVCQTPCPAARGPETDWSVDLVLCHLPKLFQLARQLSNADPLVDHLKKLGGDWPLSSVGMPELSGLNLDTFISHAALCRLYADRVVAVDDQSRLGDPRVDDLLRVDLGIHHELAPPIARKLFATP